MSAHLRPAHPASAHPQPALTLALPRRIRAAVRTRVRSEAGMTTAEYAVGTVAACGFGGVLYKIVTSDAVGSLLTDVIRRALTMTF